MSKRKKTPFIDSLGKALAKKAGEDLDRQARESLLPVYGGINNQLKPNGAINIWIGRYLNEKA